MYFQKLFKATFRNLCFGQFTELQNIVSWKELPTRILVSNSPALKFGSFKSEWKWNIKHFINYTASKFKLSFSRRGFC